jgi:hypothetical protein
MFPFSGRCCLLLFFSAVLAHAQADDLIPSSRLRPSDPTRFYPELVRLHDDEVGEIRSILRSDPRHALFADKVTKELLRKIPVDGECFARFLTAPSGPVREWAMRTLGEYTGDKTAALSDLLRVASDRNEPEAYRALAARVVGTTRMNSQTVARLVQQLPQASKELRVILLEVIATSGPAGIAALPDLKRYLDAPDASVQFHAFRAIDQIEQTSGADGMDANAALTLLQSPGTPGYLVCVALLNLATTTPTPPETTEAVLRKVGHLDPFISELAANVLQKVRHFGTQDVAALERGALSPNPAVRLRSLLQIRELGPRAGSAINTLLVTLRRAAVDGAPPREVGACLDTIRTLGANAAPAARVIVELLDEKSPIYRNAQKHEVHRLRGFLLATLAEISVPEDALPFIVGALANSDQRSSVEFAGAARAAGAMGTHGRQAVPFLVRALEERIDDDFISFDRFDSHDSPGNAEYTTCQIEALRALRRIGPTDEPAVRAVRAFLEQPLPVVEATNVFRRIPNLRAEAGQTLAAIQLR